MDGRAADLAKQAAGPVLDPLEMAMPDQATVAARLLRNGDYRESFVRLFGAAVVEQPAATFNAMTVALAAFQQGPPFLAFDSRYDRYLAGEYTLTEAEELGRRLYFSDLTNCMGCHLLEQNTVISEEPFSDHRYHNIGVPVNSNLNNSGTDQQADLGLAQNPHAATAAQRGKFRTPSLRSVAVTAPYMHNGVFKKLETALHFYNQYIVHNAAVKINPETDQIWGEPEVADNIALDLLREGQPLDAQRIYTLVVFLRTLTDRRYEHLLPPLTEVKENYDD